MFNNYLKQNKCFKLVCGAGNEDCAEVEKLVMLYSKAGCSIFDLSANLDVIDSAKRGLERARIVDNRYLCVSIGIKGDPHIQKAKIDPNTCIKCRKCQQICPQSAIIQQQDCYEVNQIRCIGCKKCSITCPQSAISMENKPKNIKEILPQIIEKNIDCIEFHALSDDYDDILNKWEYINKTFDGIMSLCVDRSKLGNEKLLEFTKTLLSFREPYTTIIQADGDPMSGGQDDFKTTLQAIATAELFERFNFPCYIMLSGGTNSKSSQLASMCQIHPIGVAIGSYARKIVKEYIQRDDFLENEEIFNQALAIAQNLVDTTLKYLN